jgi:hypothetical protein
MITNTGKSIIAKYLIGQAPSYASYIAVGCGAKPLDINDPSGDYSTKTSLDVEMLRVPIESRGYVAEDGQSKIVFTASLPTEERYEITEVGIFSAGANPAAGAYDSKTLYSFTEPWEYHTQSSAVAIPTIATPLSSNDDGIIDVTQDVFQTNADNKIFTSQQRTDRYERSRFLNNIIMVKGDDSDIGTQVVDGQTRLLVNSGNHLHLTNTSLNFTKNSPADEIRFAFSIANRVGDSITNPDGVRILLEFSSTDALNEGQWARFEVNLTDYDFSNRYIVVNKKLEELYKSASFTWDAVNVVRIFASVIKSEVPSPDYYVMLDGIRLQNLSNSSPVYGLTGYTVIKTENSETVIKSPNTSNYIEFRFGLGIS